VQHKSILTLKKPWGAILALTLTLVLVSCVTTRKPIQPVMEPPVVVKPGVKINRPPRARREFRAAWVATVANIDWPSKPGLSTADQQAEVIAILDTAVALNLNAIIFQVRPQCDAFYNSRLEPWSYYLTGVQGQAPDPYYDPLKFWIDEAHKRGLELHAWFNPYRAHHPKGGPVTDKSIVKTHPEMVKKLAKGYYWLDPAKKETRDHSLAVVMDVVENYNVDGIHFDDYFYPYPSYEENGDFPDDDSWSEYQAGGGTLSRADWRRDAVNTFIHTLYKKVKAENPWVQFGLSPFGIWQPYFPESIRGFNQYAILYADAKLWFNEGWIDYFTPQLYWPISQIPQSYPILLGWWTRQNTHHRNLWPGIIPSRARNDGRALEIINKIMVTRGMVPNAPGEVLFSMKALMQNYGDVANMLKSGPYAQQALVPPSPWLDDTPPGAPAVETTLDSNQLTISWSHTNPKDVFWYVVYYQEGRDWQYQIFNQTESSFTLPVYEEIIPGQSPPAGSADSDDAEKDYITQVAVSAVDRLGNESVLAYREINQIRKARSHPK